MSQQIDNNTQSLQTSSISTKNTSQNAQCHWYMIALLVIAAVVAAGAVVGFASFGSCQKWWNAGSLSNLGRSGSIALMAGSGTLDILLLIGVVFASIKNRQKQKSEGQIDGNKPAENQPTSQDQTQENKQPPPPPQNQTKDGTPELPSEMVAEIFQHLSLEQKQQMAPLVSVFSGHADLKKEKEKVIDKVVELYQVYLNAIGKCGTNGSGRSVSIDYETTGKKKITVIFAAGGRSLIHADGEELLKKHRESKKNASKQYTYNVIAVLEDGFDSETGNAKYKLARTARDELSFEDRLTISWFEDMINFDRLKTQIYIEDIENVWKTPDNFKKALIEKMNGL